jgi:hypothetical protein
MGAVLCAGSVASRLNVWLALDAASGRNTIQKMSGNKSLRSDPAIILGMHRSGTSALGGILEAMGFSAGKAVMPANPGNPKGYYENFKIVELHDRFLNGIGSSWHDPRPIKDLHFKGSAAVRFSRELRALLMAEFGEARPLIKDPRLCRLMPLWRPLLEADFPRAFFLLPIRHPVEVAQSLLNEHGATLTFSQGLALWLVHVLEAERATRDLPRMFTTFEDLIERPAKIAEQLGSSLSVSTAEMGSVLSQRIDPGLRHHTDSRWPPEDPCSLLSRRVYEAFRKPAPEPGAVLDGLREECYEVTGWVA